MGLGTMVGEAWKSLCLHGRPWNTSSRDYLEYRAALEGTSYAEFIRNHAVMLEPFRIDRIAPLWLGMGWAYNAFSKKAQEYDAVVEFREQFGERALFGLVREYIVSGTGVRIRNPCENCTRFPTPPAQPDGMV